MLVYMDYSLYICVVKSIRLSYFSMGLDET